jgi:two-component system chemotaxis response regulator CheY
MQILIVDDSKAMRSIVTRAVKAAGFEAASFAEATNGAEALAAIRAATPDLVVADWNMPEMTGIELLRALRAEGNGVKVGFVTSEADPGMKATAMESGAFFFVTKPFTPEAMKEALRPVRS